MNLTRSNENAPYIELQIRVVKERAICVIYRHPFNRTPRLLLIHIIFVSVKMINYFPLKNRSINCVQPQYHHIR